MNSDKNNSGENLEQNVQNSDKEMQNWYKEKQNSDKGIQSSEKKRKFHMNNCGGKYYFFGLLKRKLFFSIVSYVMFSTFCK